MIRRQLSCFVDGRVGKSQALARHRYLVILRQSCLQRIVMSYATVKGDRAYVRTEQEKGLAITSPPSSYMAYMLDLAGSVANFLCLFILRFSLVLNNQYVVSMDVCDLLRHGCCEERGSWATNAFGRLSVQFQQNGAEFRGQQREQFQMVQLSLYGIFPCPGLFWIEVVSNGKLCGIVYLKRFNRWRKL